MEKLNLIFQMLTDRIVIKVKIRHKEIYSNGELINSLHKPIENGDIFQINDEKIHPCGATM